MKNWRAQIATSSKIFITFRGDYGSRWWIDSQATSTAIIKIAQPLAQDVQFDWWVVGVTQENPNNQIPITNGNQGNNSSSLQTGGGTEGGVLNNSSATPPPAPSAPGGVESLRATEEGRVSGASTPAPETAPAPEITPPPAPAPEVTPAPSTDTTSTPAPTTTLAAGQ